MRAAEAARLQGPQAYARMHFALLEGRHVGRKDFTDPKDVLELARAADLDLPRFQRDVADRARLQPIAADHQEAVKLGIFGTPTFVFENGATFFMRIKAPEATADAVRTFEALCDLFVRQPIVDEVKRPRPPAH